MTDESFFAQRMSRFKPSPSQIATARVRELIAQGRDIIKLTAGEPDFPTPDHAKAAALALMERNGIGYTPINGTLEMRKAAQHKFKRDNDLHFELDELTVGSGTKQILFNALMATVDAGAEAIIPGPYWASYPDMVSLAGGTPVFINCEQNRGFKMTPDMLAEAITPKTKWLMFCSPSNPTGATYSGEDLKALSEVLLDAPHVHIMSDDVYEHLVYDGRKFATFAQVEPRLANRTVTCNGVSKAYSMTGWRVGFAGGPKHIISALSKMQSQSTAGASAVGQAAAAAALTGPLDLIYERTANLERRRNILFDGLNAIPGLRCDKPEGAMYVFCSCAGAIGKRTPKGRVIKTDTDFTDYLVDSVGVAVVQGEAYGMSPYFRASFVASEEDLVNGAKRIRQAMDALTD
ncbi:MAG: aminotransferase class I/II-fold pyridoxal phosphate-dependent enzyme [Chromatiales bacterium]|jgi:aspartate aminotransferase|nr:aminotransferase class I/II-fold pyridoxal phosphate-dependent enzyme [Chromatiales bacterium]